MAMESNSDNPPDQDFVELKWENNSTLLMQDNRNKDHRIRHLVEPDSVKSLVMFNSNEKPSTDSNRLNQTAANSMKIVNFPHLARFASLFDSTREGNRNYDNGVVIRSSNHHQEVKSNSKFGEEAPMIQDEDSNKKMKIDEEIIVPDEQSRVFAENSNEFDDDRRRGAGPSVVDLNDEPLSPTICEDSDSGCSGEDEHGEMEGAARTMVDNKRRRTTHHDQRKRKDKMKKKMRTLQELLPGCNKVVDKASVLDEAIEYVKTLQHQLQVMSIAHLFTPTPMMIPSPTPQVIMPALNQFSSPLASTGMSLGVGSGFGLGPAPISPQMCAMPGFAPCIMPYVSGLGEGAVPPYLLGRSSWGTTSFAPYQLGSSSSSIPPLSSYNDSNNPEDMSENMRLVAKSKDK